MLIPFFYFAGKPYFNLFKPERDHTTCGNKARKCILQTQKCLKIVGKHTCLIVFCKLGNTLNPCGLLVRTPDFLANDGWFNSDHTTQGESCGSSTLTSHIFNEPLNR